VPRQPFQIRIRARFTRFVPAHRFARFVSGHRFSGAASAEKSVTASAAAKYRRHVNEFLTRFSAGTPPSIATGKHLGSGCFDNQKGNVMTLAYKIMESPVGKLKLVATDQALVAILWEKDSPRRVCLTELVTNDRHPVLVETERQLHEYFSGKRKTFSIHLDLRGTPFQKNVWATLLAIPFGETRSYGQLAKQLGNPRATRAVGAANGRNPVSIIVPCHRVIGSSGKLTGFAGGLDVKARLLTLEKKRRGWDSPQAGDLIAAGMRSLNPEALK
jgi:methylated-DNA-[protein]-cysteine S-methyltransferase